MKTKLNSDNLIITIYSFVVTVFLGWQILSFIHVFFQLNQTRIQFSFMRWMDIQSTYLPVAALLIFLFGILLIQRKSFKLKEFPINYNALHKHLIYLILLFVGAFINYILFIYQLQQNILELINMVLAVLCLIQISRLFYVKKILAWFHPTTISMIYLSTIFLGLGQLFLFKLTTIPFDRFAYLLLIFLVVELLRIFSRFKHLTKSSYQTNMIARSLLGRYGIYFGVRVIVGIFMPLVYILYAMYSAEYLMQSVGVLLIIGEFIERLLFIYLRGNTTAN